MSRWHVDAQCHLEPILGAKMIAKWVTKWPLEFNSGFVLRRNYRDPNVSTHIRIAAVLWDETIKGLCVCAHVCVLSLMVWSQSKAAIRK